MGSHGSHGYSSHVRLPSRVPRLRLEELYLRPDESGGGRFELKGMGFRRDQVWDQGDQGDQGWGGQTGLWVLGLQPGVKRRKKVYIYI